VNLLEVVLQRAALPQPEVAFPFKGKSVRLTLTSY